MENPTEFSKYERARIIGARGLQISMDAPLLLKMKKDELEGLNYDPLKLAEKELDEGVLPITVNRPLPKRKDDDIEKVKLEETASDEEKIRVEKEDEKEMQESGEILELANVEEEEEGETTSEESGSEDIE